MPAVFARAIAVTFALLSLAGKAVAQVEPSAYCPPEVAGSVDAGNLKEVGPVIAGVYTEAAKGLRAATGVQENEVEITYNALRNRLYIGPPGQPAVELVPVRGAVKPLRWDYRRGAPMDPSAYLNTLEPFDYAVLGGCDFTRPVQFEWSLGTGDRSSAALITFLSATIAVGVKWNSAEGARETVMMRSGG